MVAFMALGIFSTLLGTISATVLNLNKSMEDPDTIWTTHNNPAIQNGWDRGTISAIKITGVTHADTIHILLVVLTQRLNIVEETSRVGLVHFPFCMSYLKLVLDWRNINPPFHPSSESGQMQEKRLHFRELKQFLSHHRISDELSLRVCPLAQEIW